MNVVLWVAVAVLGTAMVWKASGALELSSERLAARFGLSEVIRGSVIVAIGSSFPELSAAVLATIVHGEFELGVAAIVGSAIFNVLAVPGLSGVLSAGGVPTNRELCYKESLFYALSVAVMTLVFALGVVYHPQVSDDIVRGKITVLFAFFPLAIYGFYVFVQAQEVADGRAGDGSDGDGRINALREVLVLAGALVFILAGVEMLVRAAVAFGEMFGTPSFLWGATVVAAGTSLPDGLVSVRAARNGAGITSLANVIGSNVFDLLVCVPAGVILAGGAIVNFDVAAPLMFVLMIATVLLFVVMRTNFVITRSEAVVLLVCYIMFVGWIGAENFNIIDLVPGIPPTDATG